ncbi:M14 family metallopeptidase [Pendulispora brunnea]|uniref:M14 family metallopeptidase n=1 Tax=Pendulispora brunnea TaxID=2905690 RepID=A0ABZ2JWG0_9BACT
MTRNLDHLRTIAEQTRFEKTGRYDEVLRLARAYAETWPDAVRCFDFGVTPEQRPMIALIVSRTGALTAKEIAERKIPVLFLQGGIHPGESDGKDAGFMALRDMLEGRLAAGALEKSAILFVPVFNVDGHERFGKWNRPNQVGPEEMGWRSTSQNLNLNRDYAKVDSPEMQAMMRLLLEWNPLVYADLHVTNGADFEHDVSVQVEPIHTGDPALRATGLDLREHVIAKLAAEGSLPLPFYPSLARQDDPESGFEHYVYSPRFSTGYWNLRNRFTLLLETHSWKSYEARIRMTLNTIAGLTDWTVNKGPAALALVEKADIAGAALGGQPVEIDYGLSDEVTQIEFRGYAYTREPSPISGQLATRYDPSKPQIWRVPLRTGVVVKRTAPAPKGGYIVPAAYAQDIGARLALHGIASRQLSEPMAAAPVEAFRASKVTFQPAPFEGRTMVAVEGAWHAEKREIPSGSLFVPIAQRFARLAMALLEPQAPDSFGAWGFFNAVYERKEYMDAYVAEQVAREMLAADPELAAEFARKLGNEPDFARSPAARLDFFYRRHPSFDERLDLYPVYRTDADSF